MNPIKCFRNSFINTRKSSFSTSDPKRNNSHNSGISILDTNTVLIQVHNLMTTATELKQIAATVFLDQSSAYDLIDHCILTEKFKCYNFSPSTMDWFKSYLSDRQYSYQTESRTSAKRDVGPYGVPQSRC